MSVFLKFLKSFKSYECFQKKINLLMLKLLNLGTRIVNLPIKRSFERDRPTMLRCALTTLCFGGGGLQGKA